MASKSKIWKYFVKTDDGGKYKTCGKYFKSKNTTTNLHNHLKAVHKIEAERRQQKVKKNCSNIVNEIDELLYSNKNQAANQPNNNNNDEDTSISQQLRKINLQSSIPEIMENVQSYTEGKTKYLQITNAIVFMILKDCLPFRTVEKLGFLNLMKILCPRYKVPNREKISDLIDNKYDVLSTQIKDKLSQLNAVSLTCDIWTETTNTQSFLGVTAHYIYENILQSSTITVKDLNQSHTAEYLEQILKNICNEWNISIANVSATVTDNAANIIKAVQQTFTRTKHLPCLAHTLNLCVTDAVSNIVDLNTLIEQVKEIVAYFKRCVNAADELKKITGDHFDEPTRLKQSVMTRWNSTYYMLQRFLLLKKEVATVILQFTMAPNMIHAKDIEILQEVTYILEPFENVTREICAEKHATCGKIIPTIYNLVDDLKSLPCQSEISRNLKKRLLNNIEKRFERIEFNLIPAVAMLMDPRFKKMYFQNALAASNAIAHVNSKLEAMKKSTECVVLDNSNNEIKLYGIWKHHEKRALESSKLIEQNHIGLHFELKQYLSEPTIAFNEDPLSYWINRKNFFSSLYKIAEEYLVIPATSVPSERLFSAASNIMTKRRNRIKPEKLHKILFLQCLGVEEW